MQAQCHLVQKCYFKKIKRTSYVTRFWQNAMQSDPTNNLDPLCFGWRLEDNSYQQDWLQGDVATSIVEVVKKELDDIGMFENTLFSRLSEILSLFIIVTILNKILIF